MTVEQYELIALLLHKFAIRGRCVLRKYDIVHCGRIAGSAEIHTQGLYCCIRCILNLADESIKRVILQNGNKRVQLGVCIPHEGGFVLTKKIPAKQLDLSDDITFFVSTASEEFEKREYAVCSKEPFSRLKDLKSAHFKWRDGIGYIDIDSLE